MTAKTKNVREYITQLEESKDQRPPQVKDGLEIYIDLWRRAIERGVVSETDLVSEAQAKIEKSGGLYEAAGS